MLSMISIFKNILRFLEYKKDLTEELTAHIDPDLAEFVTLLCQGDRDQGKEVNAQKARKDAEKMNKVTRLSRSWRIYCLFLFSLCLNLVNIIVYFQSPLTPFKLF